MGVGVGKYEWIGRYTLKVKENEGGGGARRKTITTREENNIYIYLMHCHADYGVWACIFLRHNSVETFVVEEYIYIPHNA